jgi:hypothetical protein
MVWAVSWAAGLSVAALVGMAGFPYAVSAVLLAGVSSLLLVGAPARASAIAAGSSRPLAEGLAFALVCAIAVLTYAFVFSPDTGPNINTTATMAARQRYVSSGPHLPPELALGFWLTVGTGILGSLAAIRFGVPAHAPARRRIDVAIIHSLWVAGALVIGCAFLGIAGPLLIALSGPAVVMGTFARGLLPVVAGGLVAGAFVGQVMTSARCRLQPPV